MTDSTLQIFGRVFNPGTLQVVPESVEKCCKHCEQFFDSGDGANEDQFCSWECSDEYDNWLREAKKEYRDLN